MNVVVLGAGGQVGSSIVSAIPDATALSRGELDVSDQNGVDRFDWSRFDVIVNAAAFTAVDDAETPAGRAQAWQANAVAVGHIARAARARGSTLVHFSTEYVFDGSGTDPRGEDDRVAPLSAYGASKAAGDLAASTVERHYILRTSWVVGEGRNFVATMLDLAGRGVDPSVVADQIGRPTFADDLARGVVELLDRGAPFGTYNLTNSGEPASWAEVARATLRLAGHSPERVSDTSTAEYFATRPGSARRPLNSVLALDKAAAAGVELPDWQVSLARYVESRRGTE